MRKFLIGGLITLLILFGLLLIWFFFFREKSDVIYPQPPGTNRENEVFPEVWSQKSPEGESYEFKVNCFGKYSKLEACFLWDLDAVEVTGPDGRKYALGKDFNINEYSGETTRRWVLYGEIGEGLPKAGNYLFEYSKNGQVVFSQTVAYSPSSISYPTNVTWERNNKDLKVYWSSPKETDSSMWYKVIVENEENTPNLFVSDTFQWNAKNSTLKDIPLQEDGKYRLNVAIYYPQGYAYSEYIKFTW